jgi:Domain of unknown function (DUF5615)
MAHFYSNENIPLPVVEELRALGHDVITTQDAGKANQSVADSNVLAFAVDQERILLTLNRRHFIRLHQTTPEHWGIVVCTYDPDFEALARRIVAATTSSTEMRGQLVRINRPSA